MKKSLLTVLSLVIFALISCKNDSNISPKSKNKPKLYYPNGVAIDAVGNMYIADYNYFIIKVTPEGVATTFAGNSTERGYKDGQGVNARFDYLGGICVDATGNVYVSDKGNNRIRKITPEGLVTTFAGNDSNKSIDGIGADASFADPFPIAADKNGNIYVGDRVSNKIRKITQAGVVSTLAGGGPGSGMYNGAEDGQGVNASFETLQGLSIDAEGNVYVADANSNRIRKVTPSGLVSTFAGSNTAGDVDGQDINARFSFPAGIAVDTNGNVFVADFSNHKVRKITPSGLVSTYAGSSTIGNTDGASANATFNQPFAAATDLAGNLYIVDDRNVSIRKISTNGIVSTVYK